MCVENRDAGTKEIGFCRNDDDDDDGEHQVKKGLNFKLLLLLATLALLQCYTYSPTHGLLPHHIIE